MSDRSRNWIGTLNNPVVETEVFLKKMFEEFKGTTYVCGQLEKGENGTPHIQYYVNTDKAERLSAMKKRCAQTHWEVVRVNKAA